MFSLIRNNIAVLNLCKISYSRIIIVYLLSFLIAILEASGIGMFLPIGEYLLYAENQTNINTASWKMLEKVFGYINIKPSITYIIVFTIILIITRQLFTYLKLILAAKIQYEIVKTLRNIFFSSLIELDFKYNKSFKTGENTNLATNEIHNTAIAGIATFDILTGILLIISYFIIMTFLSINATITVIFLGIFLGYLVKIINKKIDALSKTNIHFNNIFSQHFVERLKASKFIKLNDLYKKEYLANKRILLNQYKINLDFIKIHGITVTAFEPLVLSFLLPMLIILVHFGVDLSIIGMFAIILARFVPTFKMLIGGVQSFVRYNASCEKVLYSLKSFSNMREIRSGNEIFPKKFKRITFNRVYFKYKDSPNYIFKDFSVVIKANKINAIVGPSGVGKTTLIDLLSLLIEPIKGSIKVDNLDTKVIEIKSLRKNFSYVDQKPFFFKGSIMENLSYAQPKPSKELCIKAAKLARAHNFIDKLPRRYNYMLGESGTGLSGGQLQRLEIARALATGRKIIVLDEPTSNLDINNSKEILDTLVNINKETGVTIIIISHKTDIKNHASNLIKL